MRREYQLLLPMDVEIKIEMKDSVRRLIEVTENMDYSRLNSAYTRLPRSNEATPKQMFQLVIMGFMEQIYSTRRLEKACKTDIRFMYILNGKKAPDHNRFWKFIKERLQGEVCENLFFQLTERLWDEGEIEYKNIFIDGTKIEANANRYSFVWKKSVNKYEARLDEKLDMAITSMKREYGLVGNDPDEILSELRQKSSSIPFVYGRGKRKSQIQRDVELMESYVSRKHKYADYNGTFRGRNSFSKTDKDATFMRMKDDHMMNGQLKPGYNLQLGVEGEYIVGVDISSERSDELTLFSLLDRIESGSGKRHENVTLDAGYESEENYKGLIERGQTAYIKPQNYEKSKKRKYKTNAYLRENMPYDAENDIYTCPNGNLFTKQYMTKRRSKSGFEAEVTVYECSGCNGCPLKINCTKAKNNRKLYVSKDFVALRAASRERITSDFGKQLRLNRSIQSEGAFGILKQDYAFRRFLRRGMSNVLTETLLYAIAYNINKLHLKKLKKRQGVTIHLLNSA